MKTINGKTNCFLIIGYPVSHSLSPFIHNIFFRKYNINSVYLSFPLKKENLFHFIEFLKYSNIKGGNITMPLKIEFLKYCNEINEKTKKIGAINTFKVENGNIIGYNTDGKGFLRFLNNENINIINKKIALFGTGGAARSLIYELLDEDVELFIIGRNFENINDIKENNSRLKYITYKDNIKFKIESFCDIIINATSVGMYSEETVVNLDCLTKNTIVCDIIYHPLKTFLIKESEKKGCRTYNGIQMLIYQAAEAFKIWTNIDPNIVEVKEKIINILR